MRGGFLGSRWTSTSRKLVLVGLTPSQIFLVFIFCPGAGICSLPGAGCKAASSAGLHAFHVFRIVFIPSRDCAVSQINPNT